MSEFEIALQQCLQDLDHGAANVEECLRRYPSYARELEPILMTTAYLARGQNAQLSPAFKARVRSRLLQEMYARPRGIRSRSTFSFLQLATSLAVVLLMLVTAGTVYAQRALPGEAFYRWKLVSEEAWRWVSPDPVGADLLLAERRLNELLTVRDDPALQAQALDAYLAVATRLRSQIDGANEDRVLAALTSQSQKLEEQGLLPEQPDPTIVAPAIVPTLPPVITPLPTLETPQITSTDVPQVLPTVETIPDVLPTPDAPDIIPTVRLPVSLP